MPEEDKQVGLLKPLQQWFNGEVTEVSYTSPRGQTYETWDEDGKRLLFMNSVSRWALGDWMIAGGKFKDDARWQGWALAARSENWWNEGMRVAHCVPPENRRPELPWSYHLIVAPLDLEEQRLLLERCIEQKWNIEEMRAEAALVKNGNPPIAQNNYKDAKDGVLDTTKGKKTSKLTRDAKKAAALQKQQRRIARQEEKRAEAAARKAARAKGEKVPLKAVVPEPEVILYDVLLVDPWRDKDETIENIVELPVMDIIADNAIMFMWTTVEQLPESMALLETWGFDYRSQLVWRKSKATITAYTREQHELVLIGKRGEPAKPAERERPPSVFEAPVPRQGRHPDILFQILEKMLPKGKRVVVLPTGDLPLSHQDTWHMWNAEPKGKRRVA